MGERAAELSLEALLETRKREFSSLGAPEDSVFGVASDLWKGYFDARPNFISEEDFQRFRSPDYGASKGLGDNKRTDAEFQIFGDAVVEAFEDYFGDRSTLFEQYAEPTLGQPQQFDYNGHAVSTLFVKMLYTVDAIKGWLNETTGHDGPYRICEIGPGFGMACYVLHQVLDVEAAVLIDLPENLYLSSTYLPHVLQEADHVLFEGAGPLTRETEAKLNFVPSPLTDKVEGPFDLILNMSSIGEMDLETANAYLKWGSEVLSDTGIFVSVNRLNAPHTQGAKKATDFDFLDYQFHEFRGFAGPGMPHHQNHTLLVMKRLQSDAVYDPDCFNALSQLIALGFDDELDSLLANFCSARLTAQQSALLSSVWDLFTETDPKTKVEKVVQPIFATAPEVQTVLLAGLLVSFDLRGRLLGLEEALLSLPLSRKVATKALGALAQAQILEQTGDYKLTLARLAEITSEQSRYLVHWMDNRENHWPQFQAFFQRMLFPEQV